MASKDTKKTTEVKETTETKESIKIPTEKLIQSKQFKNKYQKDFMRTLLSEPSYSVEEAKKILEDYFEERRT